MSTDSAPKASNIDIAKHEFPALAARKASFRTLFKSTTLANAFATLTNPCACHVFCNMLKSLRRSREKHFEPPKTFRDRRFLTILTSKSLSRHSVVQIFRSSTSKSAPSVSVFKEFDFQICLAPPQRGAKFAGLNFQKWSEHAVWCLFFRRNRSSATAWCKFCRHLAQPVLRNSRISKLRKSPKTLLLRGHWVPASCNAGSPFSPPAGFFRKVWGGIFWQTTIFGVWAGLSSKGDSDDDEALVSPWVQCIGLSCLKIWNIETAKKVHDAKEETRSKHYTLE